MTEQQILDLHTEICRRRRLISIINELNNAKLITISINYEHNADLTKYRKCTASDEFECIKDLVDVFKAEINKIESGIKLIDPEFSFIE